MEGKNCFRNRWTQTPFYSGGSIALLAVLSEDEGAAELHCVITACDNTVNVVDRQNGSVLGAFAVPSEDVVLHLDAISCVGSDATLAHTDAFVPRGSYIAFSTRSLQVYVVNVVRTTGGLVECRLVHNWLASQQAVSLVRFTDNGLLLLTCSTDGTVKGWNIFHHHLTHNLKTPSGVVTALAFSEDMTCMAVGNFEGWVTIVQFIKKEIRGSSRVHTSAVEALQIQGEALYTIGRDRKITISNGANFTERVATVVVKEYVSAALFDASGVVHVGATDGVVATYRAALGEEVRLICRSSRPLGAKVDDIDEEFAIRSLTTKPRTAVDHGLLRVEEDLRTYSIMAATSSFHVVQYQQNQKVLETTNTLVGFLDQVLDIKLLSPSQEGNALDRVVVTNAKEARLFQGNGATSHGALRGHSDIVLCCDVSTNGQLVATGSKDKSVRVWDVATCECILQGASHDGDVTTVAFNKKSSESFHVLLSVGSDGHLRLWDILKSQEAEESSMSPKGAVNDAHSGAIHCLAIAPNDQYIATGGKDKVVNIWTTQGKRLFKEATMRGHRRGVTSVAFSPADRVLASSSNDATIRLWSLVSFSCVKTLQVDKSGVLQVAFFNEGTQLVSGNAEGILRFWALAASEVVHTLESHSDRIWGIAIANDKVGQLTIVSGGADGTICVTEDYTEEEAQRLEEERHALIYNEQALSNALRKEEFADAFRLALQLNHPRHLRQVLVKWASTDESECCQTLQGSLLPALSDDSLKRLLNFTREWLTNARHAAVAAIVLGCFLRAFPYHKVIQMKDSFRPLSEALLSYSLRHATRMQSTLLRTYYLDFLLRDGRPEMVGAEGEDRPKRPREAE